MSAIICVDNGEAELSALMRAINSLTRCGYAKTRLLHRETAAYWSGEQLTGAYLADYRH